MSDWFKSIPVALDLMAFTAKFQQEVMARQIRFYRGRHQQIRTVIEKLRADNSDLKRANETLAEENHHLKQQLRYQEPASEIGSEPSYVTNQNGKRLMGVSTYQYDYPSNRPRTGSSPLNASKTPTRLSIPTKQRISEPTQSNEITRQAIPLAVSQRIVNQSNARPMSRQIGKFAYNPPETSHAPTTSLSHLQMAPKLIRPTQSTQGTQSHDLRTSSQTQINDHRNTGLQHTTVQQNRPRNMGPPPVPQARLGTPAVTATGGSRPNNISNRRFVLPQQNQRSQPQPSTSNGPQRFFPKVGQSSSASGSWFNATTSDSGRRPDFMSYRDPYADPYYGGASQYPTNQAASSYSHNQYSDNNLDFNPYSRPSHPTYDQSGYGIGGHEGYTDEPAYPPQRQPTQRSGSGTLHQKKEGYQPGADFATVPPMKKTASTMRQYRYDHQGALWTKGGRGRCIGRFCCCTIMTVLFLLVSIVLALALWVRPPGIIIGQVAPVARGGSIIQTSSNEGDLSLSIHLALNITVDNPNYFSVNFKEIKAELFYPIDNTPIGGGTSTNVVFPANSQTNWTFPFDVQYETANDPGGKVLSDLLNKCGANKQNLDIDYTITPALRILFVTISPAVSNSFNFPCPIDANQIPALGGLGSSGGS
ncbi:hypothetical protein NP233_g5585 [Leucocoprinus birnbaumii]|uniref:Late embryogenesis abundant protein LEA-2 subgroup domain-containing protein n=1 Tax=Leucocoprinus birnbaumii TaxID=56174 RepID=A0AAD5VSK9_9AGAR|nr:hypothetical protein NP233_g5585 [Leucocoprinus birnbaumii]